VKPHIFGVRHLSPMGAYQLLRILDEVKPRCVLVEGPSDCTPLIAQLTSPGVKLPVAILAYTAAVPVVSISLPFAQYSPEYRAIAWADMHGALCRFIDLPTDFTIPARYGETIDEDEAKALADADAEATAKTAHDRRQEYNIYINGLYDKVARLCGCENYDNWWEAVFEHNANPKAYQEGVAVFSSQMREMTQTRERDENPQYYRYNALREAHMRREIERAKKEGFSPEEIVVVCGAYHVMGLQSDEPALSDAEMSALARRETKITLMPYSYFKLSSQSGYGAGNIAPAYFERLWQCLAGGAPEKLPMRYLSELGRILREQGEMTSTASVIEAVRLSQAIAALKDNPAPTLCDLHEAAVACLGKGELANVATGLAAADVGTAIGELPEGVSQTPVQDDFYRQLKQLKLEKYKSAVAQDLELDLRENRRVQNEAAAFIDLDRSTFFNRLMALDVPFVKQVVTHQQGATWYEKWVLQWTPEAEIALVESTLLGETIEVAVSYSIKEKLEACTDVLSAASLIDTACVCRLPKSFADALLTLQALSVDVNNIGDIAGAGHKLSLLKSYGNIRRFDSAPLTPLLAQLFLRASLLLTVSATCDDKAAQSVLKAMNLLHIISQEHHEDVDDQQWLSQLEKLAVRDDCNSRLSGAAFAILLERGKIQEEDYSKEVSRRLSPGVPAELGAGWFEGLTGRNRYALLSRISLWRELDGYIAALDEDEFTRCVVFLRRALSSFEPGEKNSVAALLSQLWGVDSRGLAELLMTELTETEKTALDELSQFDFEE
jgi:hypothetical protein